MIKNKLLKYSNKKIEITEGLFLHHIMVSEIIAMGEEWLSQILLPFKLTKQHLSFNIIPEEQMDTITKEYEDFDNLEKQLTDEILESLNAEQRKILYDTRNIHKLAKFNNITEDSLEDMTLLEAYFRSYILEKYVGGNDMILQKVVESLKYLLKVDNIEIDEDNMVLIVKDVVIKGKNLNDENCADIIKDIIIDGELFDEICEWVLLLNYEDKSVIEKPRIYPNDGVRIQMEKILAERAKIDALKAEQNKNKMSQFECIFNYVANSDDESGDYDKVMNYTLYQLFKRYYAISYKETYKHNIKAMFNCTSEEGLRKIDTKHWLDKLKKDNR